MYRLQNLGADFNGVIMLSTLLNWATTQPGLDQGYINLLPSYAAAAWYHGKAKPAGQPLTGFLDGAREFAHGDYAAALQRGDLLPPRPSKRSPSAWRTTPAWMSRRCAARSYGSRWRTSAGSCSVGKGSG